MPNNRNYKCDTCGMLKRVENYKTVLLRDGKRKRGFKCTAKSCEGFMLEVA